MRIDTGDPRLIFGTSLRHIAIKGNSGTNLASAWRSCTSFMVITRGSSTHKSQPIVIC